MRPFGTARRSTGLLVAATVVVVDQVTKVLAAHGGSGVVLPERNPAYAFGIVGGPAPVLIIGSVRGALRVPRDGRRAGVAVRRSRS